MAFLIRSAQGSDQNAFPVEAEISAGDLAVSHRQVIQTAAAPNFRVTVDGNFDEWEAAIPAGWETAGKQTTVSSGWNRRQFALLVAVEESTLLLLEPGENKPRDAVQVAISPRHAQLPKTEVDPVGRWEWLLVPISENGPGVCYQLATPDTPLKECRNPRPLEQLRVREVPLWTKRERNTTYYEWAIPMDWLSEKIRPAEGREFNLSLLIHDSDGTGLRDWGEAAGLWPGQRSHAAWSHWPGAVWQLRVPPFDCRTPWGLCSSKY